MNCYDNYQSKIFVLEERINNGFTEALNGLNSLLDIIVILENHGEEYFLPDGTKITSNELSTLIDKVNNLIASKL